MNLFFNYCLEHTGGRFVQSLFVKGLPSSNFYLLGDDHFQRRGRLKRLHNLPCDRIDELWLENNIVSLLLENEKQDNSIVNIHGHLEYDGKRSDFQSCLMKEVPPIKVFGHVRDPLLIANTVLWTKFMLTGRQPWSEESQEQRIRRISYIVKAMVDVLSTPKDSLFIYPVDLIGQAEISNKISFTSDLMNFCNIRFTAKMQELVYNYRPVGSSREALVFRQNLSDNERRKGEEEFLKCKKTIKMGGSFLKDPVFQKILGLEFAFLQKQEILKRKMESVGYRNLSWF